MKKISFEERKGQRVYLLRKTIPQHIDKNEIEYVDEYGAVKLKNGELINSSGWNLKGEFFAHQLEGEWYKIEEDIGFDCDDTDPWDSVPWYYEHGFVAILEGTEDEKRYIFDGFCNLYQRPNGETGTICADNHPNIARLFTI